MKYIKTPLPIGTHLWKTEDFFALGAEPEDRVEFALHHLQSGKYPEYESVFGSGSSGALTVEEFDEMISETVADSSQSYGYTAQTRAVCQRFTLRRWGPETMPIITYCRICDFGAKAKRPRSKGVYRSEYRLAVVNGAVKVMQTADGEDPASGRWILQKTAGGKYRIFNAAANKALTVENNTLMLTPGNCPHPVGAEERCSLADGKRTISSIPIPVDWPEAARMILRYLTGKHGV